MMGSKDLSITFISRSAPFVAQKIAELYGFHFFRWKKALHYIEREAIKRPSNLFIVGLYFKGAYKHTLSQYVQLSEYFNKTIIVFAGTDLIQLKGLSSKERRRLFRVLKKRNTEFYAVGERAQQEAINSFSEMKALGIDVGTLHFPIQHRMPTNIPAMPDLFKVGCYLPPSASEFYGFDIIKKTSRLIPDVEFHLYSLSGGSRSDYSLPKMGYKNIICYSSAIKSKDMSRFISKMSCGLRVVKHDGNPMSLAEYNAMGRWFVYNIEMPHCDLLKDRSPEKLVEIIRSVRSRDGLNHEGSSFYRKRHDKNKFLKDITDIYNKG